MDLTISELAEAAREIRDEIARRNSEIVAKIKADPVAWKNFINVQNEAIFDHYFGATIGNVLDDFLQAYPSMDVDELLEHFPRYDA